MYQENRKRAEINHFRHLQQKLESQFDLYFDKHQEGFENQDF